MAMRKKIITGMLLSCCIMQNVGAFPIHFFAFSPDTQDIKWATHYLYEIMSKYPKTSLAVGSATAISLYLLQDYWYQKVSPYIALHSTRNSGGSLILEKHIRSSNSGKSLEEMQESGARWYYPGQISTKFKDAAGLHEAKAEIFDFVDFLRDPQQFLKMGAKIPKGILLAGEPGTGKTLLARAVAGEANVAFCYVNASEFIEAIVGIGAARVRSLFKKAKEAAPCIIFIDELDSIGHKRGFSGNGGDNEATQTLNQLLAEMDGFEVNENPIIVIGATNRIDVLDPALLRPGRFDHHVIIRKPHFKDRIQILDIHLRGIQKADDIDLSRLGRATTSFTGADLAKLVNDAAILAVRSKAKKVSMHHFEEAYDNMTLGRVSKNSMDLTEYELWETAVHEAGHALLYVYQPNATPLYKISIEPRSHSLGVTHSLPEKEKYSSNYQELFAHMVCALGGSVAEELVYGNRGTGALSDLARVRGLALDIVAAYGMSDEFRNISFIGHDLSDLAPEVRDRLEKEVQILINKAQDKAKELLSAHRLELDALVKLLLEKQVVSGDEVYEMCGVPKPGIQFSLIA